MFDAIRGFIRKLGEPDTQIQHFTEDDTRLAVAALMVHCMSVDGSIDQDEEKILKQV